MASSQTVTIPPTPINTNAAIQALQCQDAVNGLAVAAAMADWMSKVKNCWSDGGQPEPGPSTDVINQHPVMIMFLTKLAHLARYEQDSKRLGQAQDACEKLAAGHPVEWEITPL